MTDILALAALWLGLALAATVLSTWLRIATGVIGAARKRVLPAAGRSFGDQSSVAGYHEAGRRAGHTAHDNAQATR